jgi:hypothetical protein
VAKWPFCTTQEWEADLWFGVREPLPPGITQGLELFINTNISTERLTQESWNAAWERLLPEQPGA